MIQTIEIVATHLNIETTEELTIGILEDFGKIVMTYNKINDL